MTIAAVPKTFGIKFGGVVLSFVLFSRVLSMLTLIILPESKYLLFAYGLVCSLAGLAISFFFSEKLDIVRLSKRNFIVLSNFGISRRESDPVNF